MKTSSSPVEIIISRRTVLRYYAVFQWTDVCVVQVQLKIHSFNTHIHICGYLHLISSKLFGVINCQSTQTDALQLNSLADINCDSETVAVEDQRRELGLPCLYRTLNSLALLLLHKTRTNQSNSRRPYNLLNDRFWCGTSMFKTSEYVCVCACVDQGQVEIQEPADYKTSVWDSGAVSPGYELHVNQ